jgi:hypothetical protein
LNHLYYRQETFFVVEGSSLRSAKATREAMACERLGDCLHLTILVRVRRPFTCGGNAIDATFSPAQRHPVDRVISRYWFEGRWGLFKKPLKDEEISFGDWLREKRQIHAGHRNERLWSVTSELYTKTLAGVVVDKHLQLSFVHLETAKEWLDAAFPLITEWLSTPHAARALGKRLCFADGSGKPPIHVPKRRAAGGHTARRPKSWLPSMEDLELLWSDNRHDLELYDYATKLVGERFADASLGPLPDTPPTASASKYRAWLAHRNSISYLVLQRAEAGHAGLDPVALVAQLDLGVRLRH